MKRNHYSKRAGPTLKAKLAELAEAAPHERHSLESEIDVMRLAADEAMQLFELTCITKADTTSASSKAIALSLVRDAMTGVGVMVEKASKVRATSQSTVDLQFLDFIVGQVQKIIERHVTPISLDAVDRIIDDLNDIALPDRLHKNTAPAAARQIREAMRAMDDTLSEEQSA